jgi:hypothetical protein
MCDSTLVQDASLNISAGPPKGVKNEKIASDKESEAMKFFASTKLKQRKQAGRDVSRVGVHGLKAPSDTNESLPTEYRK